MFLCHSLFTSALVKIATNNMDKLHALVLDTFDDFDVEDIPNTNYVVNTENDTKSCEIVVCSSLKSEKKKSKTGKPRGKWTVAEKTTLANLVEKEQCIWDLCDQDHSNPGPLAIAWKRVSEGLVGRNGTF